MARCHPVPPFLRARPPSPLFRITTTTTTTRPSLPTVEKTRGLLRAQSLQRSNPSSRRVSVDPEGGSTSGGYAHLSPNSAPRPARLSDDGRDDVLAGVPGVGEGGDGVGGSSSGRDPLGAAALEASPGASMGGSPGQSLSAEIRARRKAEEEAEAAAKRAEEDAAAQEKAAEERAAASEKAGLPPPKYVCPITLSVMDDPVTACDGTDYERSALEMWLELGNDEFPGSGVKITSREFTPNPELKAEIAKWRAFKL
eukprot:XP_001694312.1 predicted protein [Chlamydomonas reinhardtii]